MGEREGLLAALSKEPESRGAADHKVIAAYLRNLACLCGYQDLEIESLATCVRLSHHDAGDAIYEYVRSGQFFQ